MERSKNFFELEEQPNGKVSWNKILIKALEEKRISIKDEDYVINPIIQAYFTNTKSTIKKWIMNIS